MSKISTIIRKVKDNVIELWASSSLLVGLPIVAGLYFDFRASLLAFFLLSSVVGTFALRNK